VLIRIHVWILDHLSIFFTIAEYRILEDFYHFAYCHPPIFFTKRDGMPDDDKAVNPQHFGRDLDPYQD